MKLCKRCGSDRIKSIKRNLFQRILSDIICSKNTELKMYKCEVCSWKGWIKENKK